MMRKSAPFVLALGGLILAAAPSLTAQVVGEETGKVMGIVDHILEREHLSQQKVDDEVSQRAFKAMLSSLDPMKSYFTEEDVKVLGELSDYLDDMLANGDLRFAQRVFERFVERVAERTKLAEELADAPQDFTVDESLTTDHDSIPWAPDQKEIRERWRKRVKYDLLRQRVDGVSDEEAKTAVKKRYRNVLRRVRQFDDEDILSSFLSAISGAFDPHTSYFAPKAFEDMQIHMRLNYQGIGAHLQDQDGEILITKIIPGGAAAKHGLIKDGDQIISVSSSGDDTFTPVDGMKLSDVVKLIRGKEGTVVRMRIKPKGQTEEVVYELTRSRVELRDESALGKVFEVDGKKIGVIDLPSFYRDTDAMRSGSESYRSSTRDVAKILADFKREKVDSVVVDLRYNGGGLLDESVDLTGLFIDQGPVVQVKDGEGRLDRRDDDQAGMIWSGPLVVLTSRMSASASEIFAGAIQDYDRGLVVGDPATHGKGTVQQILDLGRMITRRGRPPALGALKITMQKFYRASGDSTQLKGVHPHLVLPSVTSLFDGEAELPQALPFDQIEPLPHQRYGKIRPDWIAELQKSSESRRNQSSAFQRIHEDMERYRKAQDMKAVPLEEQAFRALQARKEETEQAAEALTNTEPDRVIKRDDYLDEVLRIAKDYADVLAKSA